MKSASKLALITLPFILIAALSLLNFSVFAHACLIAIMTDLTDRKQAELKTLKKRGQENESNAASFLKTNTDYRQFC